jgi:polyphosphate kinase
MKNKLFDRELSWLSFNHRVLQEASDPAVPLYERMKFLAIFSSNLDEFFRVRVASIRSLLTLKKKTRQKLDFDAGKVLKKIYTKVDVLQDEVGKVFKRDIISELRKNNVFLINETELRPEQKTFVNEYFNDVVLPNIVPMVLVKKKITTFLQNNVLYLAVQLLPKRKKKASDKEEKKTTRFKYAIVEVPTRILPRFLELPKSGDKFYIMFLDDIVRFCLPQIFRGYNVVGSYSIKLTRDAELYIEDEFTGNLLDKIKKGLKKRSVGIPCRFLYDPEIPKEFLKFLKVSLFLEKEDLMPGGKYHNFSDFFRFPNPGIAGVQYKQITPLKDSEYEAYPDVFEAWKKKDWLFHFPYQTYGYVIDAFEKAANDPDVTEIKITQYRVAKNSKIVRSLIRAVKNGKDVTAFVEIKARFDEEVNIQSAEEMQKAGVKVLYSLPGLKVHSKMGLIYRRENGEIKKYAYLATGNFNEVTAKIYSDYGMFTANKDIADEVEKVFDFLEGKAAEPVFEHLLVANLNMRKGFMNLIENEIENAKAGRRAAITVKLNNLEDAKVINKLYEASEEGVVINLLVRSVCCLIPGIKKLSKNINAASIVDRFLEHDRVFIFHNGGNEKIFLSSADWMRRNLSRRIEVAFPIYDEEVKSQLKETIRIQFSDNVKARIIDEHQKNEYKRDGAPVQIRSQQEVYDYLKEKSKPVLPHVSGVHELSEAKS